MCWSSYSCVALPHVVVFFNMRATIRLYRLAGRGLAFQEAQKTRWRTIQVGFVITTFREDSLDECLVFRMFRCLDCLSAFSAFCYPVGFPVSRGINRRHGLIDQII